MLALGLSRLTPPEPASAARDAGPLKLRLDYELSRPR
jgi:hypothetical protein